MSNVAALHPSERQRANYRVILCFKSYASNPGVSHTGLGNCALGTAKVLRQNGVAAQPLPVKTVDEIKAFLAVNYMTVTHVVISAFWVKTADLAWLCGTYPDIEFAVNCHSNFAFLQVEPNAPKLLMENLDLEQGQLNFHLGGNSASFCETVMNAYARPCTWFPNLYYLDQSNPDSPPLWRGGELRIGMFGAPRKQKNFGAQAECALIMARRLKAQATLYMNAGRNDNGEATTILSAVTNMIGNSQYLKLGLVQWQTASQFVQTIGSMHVNLQCSNTESFNQVSADSVSMGVPVVVSNAITWAPTSWQANPDDPSDQARVGIGLLYNPSAGYDGIAALQQHNAQGVWAWMNYISAGMFGVGSQQWTANGIPLRFQGRYAMGLGQRDRITG